MTGALAIVLARAGSRGLPGKNTATIAGKPCAQWTIEAAIAATRVERVAVSSDCPALRELAHTLGVEFVTRPDDLAGDNATIDAAARHAVQTLDPCARHKHLLLLYANVPVRPPALLDDALGLLDATGADSVQSYEPVGKHHPWWTARLDEAAHGSATGAVRPWEGDQLNHGVYRRQDLPPAYIPSGGVIALRRAALMLEVHDPPAGPHAFFGADRRGIVHEQGAVVDIDTRLDAIVADAVLRSSAATPTARTTHDEEAA